MLGRVGSVDIAACGSLSRWVWRKRGEGRLVLVSLGNLGKQVILQLLARWAPRRGITVVVVYMHERSGGVAGEEFVRGRRRR